MKTISRAIDLIGSPSQSYHLHEDEHDNTNSDAVTMTPASHLLELRFEAVSWLQTSLLFNLVHYVCDLFLQVWVVFG